MVSFAIRYILFYAFKGIILRRIPYAHQRQPQCEEDDKYLLEGEPHSCAPETMLSGSESVRSWFTLFPLYMELLAIPGRCQVLSSPHLCASYSPCWVSCPPHPSPVTWLLGALWEVKCSDSSFLWEILSGPPSWVKWTSLLCFPRESSGVVSIVLD